MIKMENIDKEFEKLKDRIELKANDFAVQMNAGHLFDIVKKAYMNGYIEAIKDEGTSKRVS